MPQHDKTNKSHSSRDGEGSVKALLVGINYIGTDRRLGGCINDALMTQKKILDEYPAASIELVTDETLIKPTRDNILTKLKNLVDSSEPGDILMFHYSGHGSLKKDISGDEQDGLDETICPIDFAKLRTITVNGNSYSTDSQILDDEIREIISRTPQGVKFLMLSDSCHSGNIGDLRNDFARYHGPSYWVDESPSDSSFPSGQTAKEFTVNPEIKYYYDQNTGKHHYGCNNKELTLSMQTRAARNGGELRIISGCEKNQTAADTGKNGACTIAFWTTVTALGGLHSFFPKIFSHHIEDLKSIQDSINNNLSRFGFTQNSIISWDIADAPTKALEFGQQESQDDYEGIYIHSVRTLIVS